MKEELKKTENGENNGSGSAEKTEKKKKLLSTECIVCIVGIVIALLLLGECCAALGMFGSSIASIARVLFPTNLGETKEINYLEKCQETHPYTIDNNPAATGTESRFWCQECGMMGASCSSTNPPYSHCCRCKSNHAKGKCNKFEQDW